MSSSCSFGPPEPTPQLPRAPADQPLLHGRPARNAATSAADTPAGTFQAGLLHGTLARDDRGYLLTGRDLTQAAERGTRWPLDRPPELLETSIPGVFAAGDVRHRSVNEWHPPSVRARSPSNSCMPTWPEPTRSDCGRSLHAHDSRHESVPPAVGGSVRTVEPGPGPGRRRSARPACRWFVRPAETIGTRHRPRDLPGRA